MIRYDRLWETMAAHGMSQYRLIKEYHFSAGQIGRLKKNMHVSTHTLDTLCTLLNCGISDVLEYIPDQEAASVSSKEPKASPAPPAVPEAPAFSDAPEASLQPPPPRRRRREKQESPKRETKIKRAARAKRREKTARKNSSRSGRHESRGESGLTSELDVRFRPCLSAV